jgi:MFS family permease
MYLDKKNWITSAVGMLCNFLGGWLRYASVEQARNGNYAHARTVALISSIFIGFAAAVIICSYSAISSRWFPESERTLATTFAVQSNYAGWCVGCILFPYVVVSEDALVTVQLYQAIFLTLCFAAFLAFHREYPKGHEPFEEDDEHGHGPQDLYNNLRQLMTNNQFVLQCLCMSTLAGVSFAVPAFQTTVLGSMTTPLSNSEAAWTNFSFVFSGVLTGLWAGFRVKDPRKFPLFLKATFLGSAVSLSGLTVLGWVQSSLSHELLYILLLVLMAVCGACSLGFIGIALSAVIETTYPIDSHLSGGMVEWWLQVVGAILTQVATAAAAQAFLVCAVATWLVTLLMLFVYRQDYLKSGDAFGFNELDYDDEEEYEDQEQHEEDAP